MLSEKPRSTLSETRKVTKSTMEKKRRARINSSLTELKTILSGMVSNKSERFDKMEKADILEMTVNCVRQLQRQASSADQVPSSSTKDQDYVSGMHTCVNEVIKFLTTTNFGNSDPDVKTKLLDHLATKLTSSTKTSTHENSSVVSTSVCSTQLSPRFTCTDSLVTSTETGNREDLNNNLSAIGNKVGPAEPSPLSPTYLQVFQQTSPLKTAQVNQPIQPLFQMPHASAGVPTVPVTILVPANFCSASMGTTFLPLAFSNQSPQLITQTENIDIKSPTVSAPVMRNDCQMSPVLTVSPSSSLSPEGTSMVVPAVCDQNDFVNQFPAKVDKAEPRPSVSQSCSRPAGLLRQTVPAPSLDLVPTSNAPKDLLDIRATNRQNQTSRNKSADVLQNNLPICDNSGPVWRPW